MAMKVPGAAVEKEVASGAAEFVAALRAMRKSRDECVHGRYDPKAHKGLCPDCHQPMSEPFMKVAIV